MLQLALVSTISDDTGLESGNVTSKLVVLWVLTFILDFWLIQPLFICLLKWAKWASWSLSHHQDTELFWWLQWLS